MAASFASSWESSPNDPATVYYNARVSNQDPSQVIPISYVDNRASVVLDNPAKYRVAVVRFSVPSSQVPLFFFESSISVPPAPPGGESVVTLVHIPSGDEYPFEMVRPGDPAVRSAQAYIRMTNTALLGAWTALTTAHPGPTTSPPYMALDPITQLFSLYGQQSLSAVGQEIEVFVSYPVARLYGPLGNVTAFNYPYNGNQKAFRWRIYDQQGLNIVTVAGQPGWRMTQEYSTLPKFNTLRTLSFQVFGIPVALEYLPSNSGVVNAGAGAIAPGADLVNFILTDFEPIAGIVDQLAIQYYPQGPLRWYDLVSAMPMRAITIQVVYTDERGVTRPVNLAYLDTMTLKIEFRRTDLNLS